MAGLALHGRLTPFQGLGLAGLTLVVATLYVAGHLAAARPAGGRPVPSERASRTALIGTNAAANGAALLALGVPSVPAVALALVNLAAAVPAFAEDRRYAALLGWTGPLLPMSWPATGLGVIVFLAGAAAAPFGRRFRVALDFATATLVVHGGVVYLFRCGYNLGNFVFVHPGLEDSTGHCPADLVAHETGHTLNVAAFGSIFHYIGAIHENWGPPPGGAGHRAYAELLAESRRRAPGRPWLTAWPTAQTNVT